MRQACIRRQEMAFVDICEENARGFVDLMPVVPKSLFVARYLLTFEGPVGCPWSLFSLAIIAQTAPARPAILSDKYLPV